MMKNDAKDKKILRCGIGPDKYNRKSACSNAKEVCDAFQIAHKWTTHVKKLWIEILMRSYELFLIKDFEAIHEMVTSFTSNKQKSLGKMFNYDELVNIILKMLLASWDSKVITI